MDVLYTTLPLAFTLWDNYVYKHRRGAFDVARFDISGNARAYTKWNE